MKSCVYSEQHSSYGVTCDYSYNDLLIRWAILLVSEDIKPGSVKILVGDAIIGTDKQNSDDPGYGNYNEGLGWPMKDNHLLVQVKSSLSVILNIWVNLFHAGLPIR